MDFAFDPVDGEGDKAHAALRLEAFDGFHQADVAFLDEVAERQAVAGEAARDVHDEFEVVHDEGLRGVDVVGFLQGDGEFALFFRVQRRDLSYFGDVLVNVGTGGKPVFMLRNQCVSCHSISICVLNFCLLAALCFIPHIVAPGQILVH